MHPKNQVDAAKSVRRRMRKDALGEATRAALIEKAEAMFAEKGVEGVSIRQIGIGIGSSNSNVVGYHFGTKEALVEAILLRNRPQIEARRAELLEQATREGREADLAALLHALCQPIFERTNSDGRHTSAGPADAGTHVRPCAADGDGNRRDAGAGPASGRWVETPNKEAAIQWRQPIKERDVQPVGPQGLTS